MTPEMTPYTPSLYRPDSYGRYRLYPRVVDTPIPGAGYQVGQLFWGEQELNLDGSTRPQPYGSYSTVPLRGLGTTMQLHLTPEMIRTSIQRSPHLIAAMQANASASAPPAPPADTGSQGGQAPTEVSPEEYGFDVASEIAQAAAAAEAAAAEAAAAGSTSGGNFLTQKVGPVPYWAIGLLGLAVVGGGGYYLYSRRKPKKNRRRRR